MLVIITVRLGLDRINDEFHGTVINCMKLKQFVGAIGGKPRKAFYFVGANEPQSKLIFLDPHVVQRLIPDIT